MCSLCSSRTVFNCYTSVTRCAISVLSDVEVRSAFTLEDISSDLSSNKTESSLAGDVDRGFLERE